MAVACESTYLTMPSLRGISINVVLVSLLPFRTFRNNIYVLGIWKLEQKQETGTIPLIRPEIIPLSVFSEFIPAIECESVDAVTEIHLLSSILPSP